MKWYRSILFTDLLYLFGWIFHQLKSQYLLFRFGFQKIHLFYGKLYFHIRIFLQWEEILRHITNQSWKISGMKYFSYG